MSLLELFYHVDTFCHAFLPYWNQQLRRHGQRSRCRSNQLAMSEIMTILIYFHQMRFRDFKTYYINNLIYRVYLLVTSRTFVKGAAYESPPHGVTAD